MYNRKRSASVISGGYKTAPFKAPTPQRVASTSTFYRTNGRLSTKELKDITVRSTAVISGLATAGSTPFLLNGVAQGTTASTRIGRRLVIKSLLVRWLVQLAPTTTGGSPLRLMVVYDAQSNGAAPAITDILLTDELTSPANLSNSRRFKILIDEFVPCLGTGGPQSICWTRYMKVNLDQEFNNGSAGTITDITKGSIYAIAWNGAGFATLGPQSVFYSRVRFADD